MIALLTNPPAPLALRIDLLEVTEPRPAPLFPDLVWKLHNIIASSASGPTEFEIAKHDLLSALKKSNQFPPTTITNGPSLRKRTAAKHSLHVQGNSIAQRRTRQTTEVQ